MTISTRNFYVVRPWLHEYLVQNYERVLAPPVVLFLLEISVLASYNIRIFSPPQMKNSPMQMTFSPTHMKTSPTQIIFSPTLMIFSPPQMIFSPPQMIF